MLRLITVSASDLAASRRFYETVLAPLAADVSRGLALEQADGGRPPTRNLHLAFAARTRRDADVFWRAGVDAGFESDGEPGPRPQYHPDYYGAYLLDPDGNSVEAVHGNRGFAPGPAIDHLWIRVADLAASRSFYVELAPRLGLRVATPRIADAFTLAGGDRHVLFVRDGRPRTENARFAVASSDGLPGPVVDPDGNVVECATP
jgi:catechol 2,3-dioxygenase-like lactoylglutathione lyase family enzyme